LSIRALEEQWLDSTFTNSGGGQGDGISDEDDEAGALDDRMWGMVVGFFWPMGVVLGARRGRGGGGGGDIWSERRQWAVVMGVLVNLLFGVLRAVSMRWESI
jgi:hypothetical protein